ncbi:MAG: methyltransferase domain-containing protein [Desulfobacterota bacterium]|nr:methyltransferase domain-containing protein [Thermodesulfobacteriota bacterium]
MKKLLKVGDTISAVRYWSERANAYNEQIDGPYHRHRLAVIHRLLEAVALDGTFCVDFGCGDGVMLEFLVARGACVFGCDPVAEMVAAAQRRIGNKGAVVRGGVDALARIKPRSVDCVLALNVLAYLTAAEEQTFYREAARILKPGAALVVTHSNELFDMYTLNRLTVDFYARHFCGEGSADRIASLLTHPQIPERIVFNVRENPLSYAHKLAEFGFREDQQEFMNLHPLPPLLMDPEGFRNIDAREYAPTLDWPEQERWKLMFMCSMFGSRATLIAEN